MRVLAGDIGGTKTALALAEVDAGACALLRQESYPSADYPGLEQPVREFLQQEPGPLAAACFAVAGPVQGPPCAEQAQVTNLPWRLSSAQLSAALAVPVRLINDFQGVGFGLDSLADDALAMLQAGRPQAQGLRALIGAGTGLGQALLVYADDGYEVLPSEGGHADFAPADALQRDLWSWLHARHGHVSWERVLSGPGLVNLYSFLRARAGATPEPEALRAARQDEDPAPISVHALEQGDPVAVQALTLFVQLYGAQAGNLALTALPTGGVYIAGGIAPKILPALTDGEFIRAFRAKGRMSHLLEDFPVAVVRDERVGLRGAAVVAARLAHRLTAQPSATIR